MQSRGIKMLYGRWLIEGAPRVLLFDTGSAWSRLDEWKGDLWSVAGIPAPPGDHETNETIVFGYLVAWFLGEVCAMCRLHVLIFSSSLHMKRRRRSLLISMNGSLGSLCHSAENVVSMLPRYSPPTPLFSDDTSVQVPSTFTTTYNTLMLTTKPVNGASIIVTALNEQLHTLPMSSPPSVTSPPTRASIY